MVARRLASIDLPVPGGPMSSMLYDVIQTRLGLPARRKNIALASAKSELTETTTDNKTQGAPASAASSPPCEDNCSCAICPHGGAEPTNST